MPRLTHPDSDTVYACRECDSASNVYRREHGGERNAVKGRGDECACYDCGATFDEPAERAQKPSLSPGCTPIADGTQNIPDHIQEKIAVLQGGE